MSIILRLVLTSILERAIFKQLWFCSFDMAFCVRGKVPWNVKAKPIVFLIWHAKVGVNLTQVKVGILT
jgi:hypothetical protein